MGLNADEVRAGPQPINAPAIPIRPSGPTLKRNELFITTDTGASVREASGATTQAKETEKPIPDEVYEEGKRFFDDYLSLLTTMMKENPNILDSPGLSLEKKLYTAMTKLRKKGEELALDIHGEPIREIDSAKVEEFLNEGKNWPTLMRVMDIQASRELEAAGMFAATLPQGVRENLPEAETTFTGDDQGILSVAINRVRNLLRTRLGVMAGRDNPNSPLYGTTIGDQLLSRGPQIGVTAVLLEGAGAMAGAIVGATAGASYGFGSGGIPKAIQEGIQGAIQGVEWGTGLVTTAGGILGTGFAAVGAARRGMRPGLTLSLQESANAFKVIAGRDMQGQGNPAEIAFLKAMGINVEDFQLDGDQIVLREGRTPETTVQMIKGLQNSVKQKIETRRKFWEAAGVNPTDLDATGVQFIYNFLDSEGQQQKSGAQFDRKVMAEFRPNERGIVDRWGQPQGHPLFCREDAAPYLATGWTIAAGLPLGAADIDYDHLDTVRTVRNFMDAEKKVAIEDLSSWITEQEDKKTTTNHISGLEARISAIDNGSEKKHRNEVATNIKTELERQKKELDPQKEPAEAYRKARKELEKAEQAYQEEFDDAVAAGRTIDQEIAEVRRKTISTSPTDTDSIPNKKRAIRNDRQNRINFILGPTPPTLNNAERPVWEARVTNANTIVIAREQEEIAEIDSEVQELNKRMTRLKEIESNIKTNKKTLLDKETPILDSANENLTQIEADFTTLQGFGLTPAELRTQTIEQINARANAIHTTDVAAGTTPPRGWPTTENTQGTTRTRTINAITEAKAQHEESFDLDKSSRDAFYGELIGFGINAEELRSLSKNQLMIRINAIHTTDVAAGTTPPRGWPTTENTLPARITAITGGSTEAKNRMLLRHSITIEEQIRDFDERIKIQDKIINDPNLDRIFEEQKKDLQITVGLMKRQTAIFENVTQKIVTERAKYLDIGLIDPTNPEYLAEFKGAELQEYTLPGGTAQYLPKGYVRIMDLLFDYQKEPDRQERFERILRLLPPEKLADVLENTSSLSLSFSLATTTPDIELDLLELNDRINNGTLDAVQLVLPLNNVITRLRREAMT